MGVQWGHLKRVNSGVDSMSKQTDTVPILATVARMS